MSDRGTATVTAVAQGLPSLPLSEVVATSELMSRTDHKYVLRLNDFLAVIDALGAALSSLEINGRRVFGYSSTYFDTPDLAIFRAHRRTGGAGSRSAPAPTPIRRTPSVN